MTDRKYQIEYNRGEEYSREKEYSSHRRRERSERSSEGYRSHRHRSRDMYRDRERERERSHRKKDSEHHPRSIKREERRIIEKKSRSRSRSITPIHLKKRKLNNWDVPPLGYEGMTSEQVKATGQFPLPGQIGALKVAGLLPSFHNSSMAMSMGLQGPTANVAGFNASVEKQAKRIYVGNIPYALVEHEIGEFFSNNMIQLNLVRENPVTMVQINHEKNYCFVEFRTADEATAAMAFDGIAFQGQALKIRRPKDYQAESDGSQQFMYPGSVSTQVGNSDDKLFIGGLPVYLDEEQVMSLLRPLGQLKTFNLIRDPTSGASKGFAYCEYMEPSITDIAVQGLNNLDIGDKKLVVQRSSMGGDKMKAATASVKAPESTIPSVTTSVNPTRVLLLLNMLSPQVLTNDEEYQDIILDIREECTMYGKIIDITIPRIKDGFDASIVGKVFVLFETKESCARALRELAGRKFDGKTVLGSYYPEEEYLDGKY